MLTAKSMYLGDIVAAAECNYQSYDQLGLKCPFCGSAVFLRAGHTRNTKGQETLVGAYFAHFASGQNENWDCEARSRTKAGLEQIEILKAQARGQRLGVYNDRLWELFTASRNVKKGNIAEITKEFGDRWCDDTAKLVRLALRENLDSHYRLIADMTALSKQDAAKQNLALIMSPQDAAAKVGEQAKYFSECDRRFHIQVCCEILEFLSTPSGSFALNRLFKATLQFILGATKQPTGVIKSYPASEYARMIAAMVAGTRWTMALNNSPVSIC
jgi:hypothetical protein